MQKFLSQEWAPGIVLTAAAVVALCIANSPLRDLYAQLLTLPLGPEALHLRKPFLLWVNDALMAVFLCLVGLEIRREVLVGELSSARRLALPLVAAVGGMALPAAIYVALNHGDATALRGWAIPSATDIAFALGVLSLIGSRAPASLKVFLTAVAIIDDLGAILIIAFFYIEALSLVMLAGAAACAVALLALNLTGVRRVPAYLAVGAVMWYCVLKSGVHPTLAGVATALAIPLKGGPPGDEPLLDRLEHALKPWVNFLILPVFAFANAGLELSGMAPSSLTHSITLGIALGLLVGKALGIYAACWGLARLGWGELPVGASQLQLLGVACLCGIGFTMSLFIGTLAFGDAGEQTNLVKLGVMSGSIVSAAAGATILMRARGARP